MAASQSQDLYDPEFEQYEKSFGRRSILMKMVKLTIGSAILCVMTGLAYLTMQEASRGSIELVSGALEAEQEELAKLERIPVGAKVEKGPVEAAKTE